MTKDEIYLKHISDCISNIESYVSGGKATFLRARIVQDAVIRNFEIIGEAVKGLSKEFRDEHPTVPWKLIARFRDVLIHHYFGIDLEQVWKVIVEELPILKRVAQKLPE